MGYSNFKTLKKVVQDFSLDTKIIRLFDRIEEVSPSERLLENLEVASFFPLNNEKTKSERLVSPILLDVAIHYKDKVTFFSGENIDIDNNRDLNGSCDFFFALQDPKPYIEAPIISLAEAKDEDMDYGIAQCAAQLYGAKLFNEQEGKEFDFLYGAATDGDRWKFLKFENDIFFIDAKTYTNLSEILGVWHHIIQLYLN